MAALGSLVVKLALEHAQYTQALGKSEQDALAAAKRIQDAVDGMQARVASTVGAIAGTIAAGLSINAFRNLISGAIEGGAALNDLAIQANTSVEALSGLASIGKYSDVGADAIVNSMNKLTKNLSSATEESKGTARAVQALGLDLTAFKQLKPEDQMQAVARAMGEFQDGAGKSAVAMALYGKEGAKLLPFFKDLADVQTVQAKLTTEQAAAADNLSDNWSRLNSSSDAWKKTLANAMIPTLDRTVQAVLDLVNGSQGLREEMKRLAADGSIEAWTTDVITAMTYVIDTVQGLVGAAKIVGLAFENTFLDIKRGVETLVLVALAAKNLDFAGMKSVVGSAFDDMTKRSEKFKADMDALWNPKLMGQRIRDSMMEAQLRSMSNWQDAEQKPKLDLNDTTAAKNASAAESEYEKLIKRIQERINASQAEIEVGRQLTEGEKFRVKVLSDMDAAGIKLTDTEREALKVLLARTAVLDRDVQAAKLRTQTEQNAAEQAAQSEKERAEYADKTMKLWQQRTVAANEAIQSATDSNELAQYEATLLGETTQNRQTLVELARIDLELKRKLRDIDKEELQDYQKDALKEKATQWAEISKSIVKNRAALSETDRILSSVDSTAQQVWTNIWEGGSNVFVKLGQTLKASLLDMLYQLVLRPWVINIAANILGSLGLSGATSAVTGGSNLLSTGSNLINIGSGAMSMGNVAGSMFANATGTGIDGLLATNGAFGTAGGAGAGLASVAQFAGWAAAAYAAYKVLSSLDGGETRTGGQYAVAYDGKVTNNRRGESYVYDDQYFQRPGTQVNRVVNGQAYRIEADGMGEREKATREAVAGTAAGIDATLKALGSSARLTGFWAGLETSGNGRGGVFAGGSLSNGKTFGESGKGDNYAGTLYEKWSTNSPDAATASANFALDLKQSYIQALQSVTDVPEWVKKKLKDVTAESLSSEDADALIKLINDQITAVNGLAAMADALPLKNLKDLSFDAASGIMELVGGLDNLTSLVSNYYSLFYSEEERKAQTKANIEKTLTDAGLDVPKTRAEFRALVDAQDLNTEAGRKNYAVLMNLASAFASVTDSTEDLAAATEKKAAEDKAAAEKKAADEKAAAEKAATDALNSAYSGLERSIEAQKSVLATQREAVSSLKTELQGIFDLLDGSVRDLLGSVSSTTEQSVAQARQFIAQALRTALATGVLPDQAELSNAIATVKGQIDSSVYATAAERDYQRMVLAAQLSALKGVTGNQLTTAEKTLAGIDEQIAQLDKTLEYWKKQVEIAQGTYEATVSVNEAILALTTALTGKTAGSSGSSGSGSGSTGASPGFVVGGGGSGSGPTTGASTAFVVGGGSKGTTFNTSDPAKATTLAGYYGAVYGWSTDDFKSWASNPLNKSEAERQAAELGIPLLSTGTNYVARAGLAYLHEREAVVPAAYNPAAGGAGVGASSSSADSSALLAEIAALRDEARQGREAMQTVRTLLNDVTEGGNKMRT